MAIYLVKKVLKYAPNSTPLDHTYSLKILKSRAVNFRAALSEFFMRLHIIIYFKFNNINNRAITMLEIKAKKLAQIEKNKIEYEMKNESTMEYRATIHGNVPSKSNCYEIVISKGANGKPFGKLIKSAKVVKYEESFLWQVSDGST